MAKEADDDLIRSLTMAHEDTSLTQIDLQYKLFSANKQISHPQSHRPNNQCMPYIINEPKTLYDLGEHPRNLLL